MINWRNMALCLIAVFLAGAGCSSKTAQPDTASAAAAKTPADTKEVKKQPTSKVDESAAAQSKSSLDALQRGEPAAGGPLKDIYFDFDRYDLRADARQTLKENAAWLKANPGARVQIEGHADERGTSEYNLALGAKRAQSVMDYMVTLGTTADRLSTISYGEEVPVCREQSENCWQQNRRARFAVQTARPTS
jgi:peptidoglycan-associated lipoprotein